MEKKGKMEIKEATYALFDALRRNHVLDFIHIITNNTIDCRQKNDKGLNVLETALLKKDPDYIEYLAKEKYDLNTANDEGLSPLQFLFILEEPGLVDDAMEELIRRGASLHLKNKNGHTVLQMAILGPYPRLFKELMQLNCIKEEWEEVDEQGNTLLHFCVINNQGDWIGSLAKKINVHAKNSEGKTALQIAILKEDFKSIEKFLLYDLELANGLEPFILESSLSQDQKNHLLSFINKTVDWKVEQLEKAKDPEVQRMMDQLFG